MTRQVLCTEIKEIVNSRSIPFGSIDFAYAFAFKPIHQKVIHIIGGILLALNYFPINILALLCESPIVMYVYKSDNFILRI